MDELLAKYGEAIALECDKYLKESRYPDYAWVKKVYVLDTLLLDGCNDKCEYPIYATPHRVKNIFLPGIATLGDSLYALDELVFNGDIPYSDFIAMLKADLEGFEALREKLLRLQKFGNDLECDKYTVNVANLLVDAVESCEHLESEVVVPSFYSLERDNSWAKDIPATPDGRRSGTPISENQSPTYGSDRNGITALLCSISKLPFTRTGAGGLNLTFSSSITPEVLGALIKGYFEQGGLHVGISVIDREVLLDAMEHPERHAALTVRLYGFSEYFICLPRWQQIAVLNRTAY
jgi:formate C-acetyltransferase